MAQYRESAFAFVSRLMEQEGIYYYCEHEKDRHHIVLSDSPSSHSPVAGYEKIPFYPPLPDGARRKQEHISSFSRVHEVKSGAFATTDFNFKKPKVSLFSRASDQLRTHIQAAKFTTIWASSLRAPLAKTSRNVALKSCKRTMNVMKVLGTLLALASARFLH